MSTALGHIRNHVFIQDLNISSVPLAYYFYLPITYYRLFIPCAIHIIILQSMINLQSLGQKNLRVINLVINFIIEIALDPGNVWSFKSSRRLPFVAEADHHGELSRQEAGTLLRPHSQRRPTGSHHANQKGTNTNGVGRLRLLQY